MIPTRTRLQVLGAVIAIAGLALAGVGAFYGLPQANDGLNSAQAMYAAQGVSLTYNAQGQLTSAGTTEEATAILQLLTNDWKFPVNMKNFDPKDPLVNTRDELMFQYATITYHVLHSKVAVTLTQAQVPITYRGVTYDQPGTYQIEVQKYYAQLDRTNPIESQLRSTAWSPTALALTAQLAGAHANQAAGELAQATSYMAIGLGGLFALAGAGLVWIGYGFERPARQSLRPGAAATIVATKRE